MGKNNKVEKSQGIDPPAKTWGPADDEALRVVVNALNQYYSNDGKTANAPQRSRSLATKFGSWDEADQPKKKGKKDIRALRSVASEGAEPEEEKEGEEDPWRSFCKDMTCLDDDDERSQKFDDAQEEVDNSQVPSKTDIWPVAIVKHKFLQQMNTKDAFDGTDEQEVGSNNKNKSSKSKIATNTSCIKAFMSNSILSRKQQLDKKKNPHVDVIFANQDISQCTTYGVEVCATPMDQVRDVFARQNLAKF